MYPVTRLTYSISLEFLYFVYVISDNSKLHLLLGSNLVN